MWPRKRGLKRLSPTPPGSWPGRYRALGSLAVATDPPADLLLAPIDGEPTTIADWLTTFQLAAVVLDPFTNESAWILDTAGRVLHPLPRGRLPGGLHRDRNGRRGAPVPRPVGRQGAHLRRPRPRRGARPGAQRAPAFVHIRGDLHGGGRRRGMGPRGVAQGRPTRSPRTTAGPPRSSRRAATPRPTPVPPPPVRRLELSRRGSAASEIEHRRRSRPRARGPARPRGRGCSCRSWPTP